GGLYTLGQVDKPRAGELCPLAQIHVLGQRVVLPPAGILDGGTPPDAGGAVEIEEPAAAVARGVLDDEVAVEEDGLRLGEVRVVAPHPGDRKSTRLNSVTWPSRMPSSA